MLNRILLFIFMTHTQSQVLLCDCHLTGGWFSRLHDLLIGAVSKVFTASARRKNNRQELTSLGTIIVTPTDAFRLPAETVFHAFCLAATPHGPSPVVMAGVT